MGALIGTVAGGLTALLLAPKAGKELRKDVTKKCKEAKARTEDLVCYVSDQATELMEKAKDIAHDAKDAAECLMRDLRKGR